jgi:hypothetical protein
MFQRNIEYALVERAIRDGHRAKGKDSSLGLPTDVFQLGAFQVCVGEHPCGVWNILSAYWNSDVTGIRDGASPPKDQIEKFLAIKRCWRVIQ